MEKEPLRRKEFDDITMGWGSDGLDELVERAFQLIPWWSAHLPLTPAEYKIALAIKKRLADLGGIDLPVIQ